MSVNEPEEYNIEEGFVFATALSQKAEKEALFSGMSKSEAQQIGKKKFNEVSRRHAIEYMKSIDTKLASLSNQSIANLLKALIAMGLDIEDDEELEYWIGILTQQTLNRIVSYFNQRDSASLWKQITSRPRETSVLQRLKNYSPKEIEALSEMIQSLDKINIAKTKNPKALKRRSAILKRMNKTIKNDIQIKNSIKKQRPKQQNRQANTEENSLDILKNKMAAEGVEINGRYWNHVMSEFEATINKSEFAQNWVIDNNLRNDLDISKENEIKIEKDETNKKAKEFELQHEQEQEQQNLQRQEAEQQQQPKNSLRPTEQIQPAENMQEIAADVNKADYAEIIMIKRGVKEEKNRLDKNKDKSTQNQKNNSSANRQAAAASQGAGR